MGPLHRNKYAGASFQKIVAKQSFKCTAVLSVLEGSSKLL